MTHSPYIKCKICGGKGYYPKLEYIGGKEIEYNVKCDYCSSGWINTNKIKQKPLYDRQGRPIDRFGKVLKNEKYDEWQRRFRRNEMIREMNG